MTLLSVFLCICKYCTAPLSSSKGRLRSFRDDDDDELWSSMSRIHIQYTVVLVYLSFDVWSFFLAGAQFLVLGYYYPSTEKNRQIYPVWCSRLHNHTLFIKKLCKKLGVRPNFGEVRTPDPHASWTIPVNSSSLLCSVHLIFIITHISKALMAFLLNSQVRDPYNITCHTNAKITSSEIHWGAQPRFQSWGG